MAQKIQSFPGMEDILPGEIEKWQWLEDRARTYFAATGCSEIRTPLLEPTALFTRSIGETTDIVHKEMYTFEDRGGRSMTLRPEMTASVARSVIQNGLIRGNNQLRLFYMGAMFRAERPQAGRKRQFHQIGVELINQPGEAADVWIMVNLVRFLRYLGIASPVLRINDLSVLNGREGEKIRGRLREFFEGHREKLDEDSIFRLDKNVMRIFDSKDAGTRAVIEQMPWEDLFPETESYGRVKELLSRSEIEFEESRKLVRGLDYYTGVVFEVAHPGLGAQDAVAGGGRYDGLYRELNGPAAPCTGYSIGMERILMALEANEPSLDRMRRGRQVHVLAAVSPTDDGAPALIQSVESAVLRLREFGFDASQSPATPRLDKALGRSSKAGAVCVVLRGRDEMSTDEWTLKDMTSGEQWRIGDRELVRTLIERMKGDDFL